jgi:hypothetical protein
MKTALFATILLAGCGAPPTPEEQAIQVAYGDARQRFHYAEDIRSRPPRVEDRGDRWRIQFQAPPQTVGGDVMVDVRKSDLTVLVAVAGQ